MNDCITFLVFLWDMSLSGLQHIQSRLSYLTDRVDAYFSRIHELVEERKIALLSRLQELEKSWRISSEKLMSEVLSKMNDLRDFDSKFLFSKSMTKCEEEIFSSFQNYFDLCYPSSLPTFVPNPRIERELEYLCNICTELAPQYPIKTFPKHSISRIGSASEEVVGVRAVKFDSENGEERVFVADAGNHRIQVFSCENGRHLFSFGLGLLSSPWGLCTRLPGRVLVSDETANAVYCFTKLGSLISQTAGEGVTGEWTPLGLDVHPENKEIFVCDSKHNRVIILDLELCPVSSFGAAALSSPRDIQARGEEVFVLDTSQLCVHTFSRPIYLETRRVIGYTPGVDFLCIDVRGGIMLSVTSSHCISIYNSCGEFINSIGWFGQKRGRLVFPMGLDCDADWRIAVFSSRHSGPIQLF